MGAGAFTPSRQPVLLAGRAPVATTVRTPSQYVIQSEFASSGGVRGASHFSGRRELTECQEPRGAMSPERKSWETRAVTELSRSVESTVTRIRALGHSSMISSSGSGSRSAFSLNESGRWGASSVRAPRI
jgi:hypothetical protein